VEVGFGFVRILGFLSGTDTIDLTGVDAVAGGGDDAFTFVGTAGLSGTAGELSFNVVTIASGPLGVLKGDVNGDGATDLRIELEGVTSIAASDLIL